MRTLHAAGLVSGVTAVGLFFAACALSDDTDSGAPDGGSLEASLAPQDAHKEDAAPTDLTCREGRRRCVGLELETCENGRWISLQTCLSDEWCDVAVGICRTVDAGPDSGQDSGNATDGGDGGETGAGDAGS